MAESGFVVIGAEESPYSVKVRSYFRYKNIPHVWKTRNEAGNLFAQHARLPLIPLVVTPEENGIQDSTPIIETLEELYPDPSIFPPEPTSRFVCELLEEFGDEWGNKWMFHLRWAREIDQIGCARRLALMMNPGAKEKNLNPMIESIRTRMVDRVWFVGSNPDTAPLIERSFERTLHLLDAHLETRRYLFGNRPSFADFGLWGQIYNANRDHTPSKMIAKTRNVVPWIDRMLYPVSQGAFEPWDQLSTTLKPLISEQIGENFLRWSEANSHAVEQGLEQFEVELQLGSWSQKPQRYHAKSLKQLKAKYNKLRSNDELTNFLEETGCIHYL